MAYSSLSVFGIFCLLFTLKIADGNEERFENKVSMAEIQSCRGCTLNRLPEVKAFIYEDVPLYQNVVFKPIPGAPPELVLYDNLHQEVGRVALNSKSRKECNLLLEEWGFSLDKKQKHPINEGEL